MTQRALPRLLCPASASRPNPDQRAPSRPAQRGRRPVGVSRTIFCNIPHRCRTAGVFVGPLPRRRGPYHLGAFSHAGPPTQLPANRVSAAFTCRWVSRASGCLTSLVPGDPGDPDDLDDPSVLKYFPRSLLKYSPEDVRRQMCKLSISRSVILVCLMPTMECHISVPKARPWPPVIGLLASQPRSYQQHNAGYV